MLIFVVHSRSPNILNRLWIPGSVLQCPTPLSARDGSHRFLCSFSAKFLNWIWLVSIISLACIHIWMLPVNTSLSASGHYWELKEMGLPTESQSEQITRGAAWSPPEHHSSSVTRLANWSSKQWAAHAHSHTGSHNLLQCCGAWLGPPPPAFYPGVAPVGEIIYSPLLAACQ